jgi:high-affinity nickel-transport protein
LFIGTIEILGLMAQETNQSGGFWDLVAKFSISRAGFVILFVAIWIVAPAIQHFGDIVRKWETQAAQAYANARSSLHD